MNEVIQAILRRTGLKAYADREVERDKLETILRCGAAAPSAMNKQLGRMVAVTDRKLLSELDKEVLKAYAKYKGFQAPEGYHAFHGAPVLILVSEPKDSEYRLQNGACINENMALAAVSLGLGSRFLDWPNCFFNSEEGRDCKARLHIPEDHETVCFLALGYPADPGYIPTAKNEGRYEIL